MFVLTNETEFTVKYWIAFIAQSDSVFQFGTPLSLGSVLGCEHLYIISKVTFRYGDNLTLNWIFSGMTFHIYNYKKSSKIVRNQDTC